MPNIDGAVLNTGKNGRKEAATSSRYSLRSSSQIQDSFDVFPVSKPTHDNRNSETVAPPPTARKSGSAAITGDSSNSSQISFDPLVGVIKDSEACEPTENLNRPLNLFSDDSVENAIHTPPLPENGETVGGSMDENSSVDVGVRFSVHESSDTQPSCPEVHTSTTYASIFKDKSNILKKGKLRYIPPVFNEFGTKHASIPDELIVKQNEKWLLSLVGCFVGKRPAFPFVRFHAFRLWEQFGLVDVILNDQGYFYFKFNNNEGLQHVLKNRPWLFNDIPVLLKQWELGIEQDKIRPFTVPLWVNIYDLHSSMWDYDILSHIVSVIGVPIAIDRYTEEICEKKSGRAMFARVLVKVNADDDIPSFVEAKVMGKMKKFRLQYYWKPDRCSHCNIFGHKFIDCTDRPRSVEELEASLAKADPTIEVGPSVTKDQDIQVNQEFQQPKRRRRRPKKAETAGANQTSKPKVQYIPKKSDKPEDPKDKANTSTPETTASSETTTPSESSSLANDPPLETAAPDTQSVPVVGIDTVLPDPQSSSSRHQAKSYSDNIWSYRDPTGKIQGPFSIVQLQKWSEQGCFPKDFKIWNISSTEKESILLYHVLKRRAIVNSVTTGSDNQKTAGSLKNSDGG